MQCFQGYIVNGYKFHTIRHSCGSATNNSGVCIRGTNYSTEDCDYYGCLTDILQLEYPGWPIKRTILFKCNWFDPTANIGTKSHKHYNLVDINHKRRFNRYEPFILAMQADQVYYIPYPSLRRDVSDWWAVCKIKARSIVDVPQLSENALESNIDPFQEDDIEVQPFGVMDDNDVAFLNDPNGDFIEMGEEVSGESDDEDELQSESTEDLDSNNE